MLGKVFKAKENIQELIDRASNSRPDWKPVYFGIVKKRIKEGNLSEIIQRRVLTRAQKTTFKEAIISIYLQLTKALSKNQPYF